ncbi:MAG: UvrD-helicase domain-containing protein [Simkaniaceae bacterium]|nr:UvrD-helicase domain-containing protein [Simkaniaceae bacterium]
MLSLSQKKAVKTTQGKVLILAGAGSGKTTVIIARICELLDKGVDPREILGLTFTNKAAEEMRSRLKHPKKGEVHLATFHSFCHSILRKEIHHLGYTREFSIYDERDMERVRKTASFSEDKELTDDEVAVRVDEALRAYNALDFDRMISLTVKLFKDHPEVLKRYQYKYVMIDEYQDTNQAQFELAQAISALEGNLCVVGDDDQAIYGWRGAEVRHILRFDADHIIKLEENYRSHPLIIHAANEVIANNTDRHKKTLISTRPRGNPIEVFHAPTEKDEVEAVINRVVRLQHRYQLGEMAILYRSNALSRPFESELIRRKIPYQVFGGLELYSRTEVKDLICYLRFLHNDKDQEALLRIINYPSRGISNDTLDELTKINRAQKCPLIQVLRNPPSSLHTRAKQSIETFVHLMDMMRTSFKRKPLDEAMKELIDVIGYKQAIEQEFKTPSVQEAKWQNIQSTIDWLKEVTDLGEFLSESTLNQNHPKKKERSNKTLNLMTFHSAKGLEFPVCFLVGLEDDIIPHSKCFGLEEERRLFYVGITRAKDELILSMSQTRTKWGKSAPSSPSRFLYEIPKEVLRVSHWNQ